MVGRALRRGDVVLVASERRKARPCLVVSPDVLNDKLPTFVVAPMTTGGHGYPFRVACRFEGTAGFVVLDQMRTVDRARIGRRLGRISSRTLDTVLQALQAMFAA